MLLVLFLALVVILSIVEGIRTLRRGGYPRVVLVSRTRGIVFVVLFAVLLLGMGVGHLMRLHP